MSCEKFRLVLRQRPEGNMNDDDDKEEEECGGRGSVVPWYSGTVMIDQ